MRTGNRAVGFKAIWQLLKATINLRGYYSDLKSKPNGEANSVAVPSGWQIEPSAWYFRRDSEQGQPLSSAAKLSFGAASPAVQEQVQ